MARIGEYLYNEFHKKHPYTGQKSRGVYNLASIPDAKLQAHRNCLSSLTNLTLLKAEEDDEEEDEEQEEETERPVTPINETIRAAPKTYSALCKHVRRRINPRPYWTHISIEDQRSLGAVLLGEVNAIWSVFRQQVDDPFLTTRQNKELQRRITVHIVTVCEQLFLYFCNHVKVLNARGVFSEAANMSRIRGQIAVCASKYLNLLAVRRHIIADLRKTTEKDTIMTSKNREVVTPVPPRAPRQLSFYNLIATTRTKVMAPSFNVSEEIRDMKKRMPSLDLSAATTLVPLKPSQSFFDDEIVSEASLKEERAEPESALPMPIRKLRKWFSEPFLPTESHVERRKEEDGLESPSMPSRAASPIKVVSSSLLDVHSARETYSAPPMKYHDTRARGDMEGVVDVRKDLENLMNAKATSSNEDTYLEEDEGIPPLIQAITRREMQEEKLKRMKKKEQDLDERQHLFEKEQNEPLPTPKYPQPPVIQMEIPGHANPVNHKKITIRSSDIHIPDRVELPPVALNIHGPLYNDLTGDINPATVKELDANLFQGEELKEVYDEIMKTVPNDHLVFDDDAMVARPAEGVDINKVIASSTLTRPKSQQIINPAFKKDGVQPPWGGEAQDVWERNNRPSSIGTSHTESYMNPISTANFEGLKVDKAQRAHASWLAWWKATVNTDDYFKYLSTKETDFLGAIYHFYDSEVSSSEGQSSTKTAQLESDKKRDEMMSEIKLKKEHYVRGLWNVNSVALGGLGRYPDLEEYASSQTLTGREEVEDESEHKSMSSELVVSKPMPALTSYERSRTNSLDASSKASFLDKVTTSTSQGVSPTISSYKPPVSKIQQRFEAVWRKLKMSTSQKLNAALKYSSDELIMQLDEIILSWERVAILIMKREKMLHDLEVFERNASDPHRFFQKGAMGSSATRLKEAKTRAKIYQKLETVENMIAPLLHSIHVNYDDYVTFETRPYHEKMAMDKTEMLYWLQQERRCMQLDRQGQSEQLKQFMRDNHMTVTKTNPLDKQQLAMHVSHISIDQKT